MSLPAFWEGLAVGLAISGLGGAVLWWVTRAGHRVRGPSGGPVDRSYAATPPPGVLVDPPPVLGPTYRAPDPPSSPEGTGSSMASTVAAAPLVAPRADPAPGSANGGQVMLSQRVLLHIASQGRLASDEIPPRALTQAGMVEALDVQQGALTGVLRRLVAAGILDEERQHVQGADRRLKVYRLTPSGEQLYREVRARRASEAGRKPR